VLSSACPPQLRRGAYRHRVHCLAGALQVVNCLWQAVGTGKRDQRRQVVPGQVAKHVLLTTLGTRTKWVWQYLGQEEDTSYCEPSSPVAY
jgi:hypothetical protein